MSFFGDDAFGSCHRYHDVAARTVEYRLGPGETAVSLRAQNASFTATQTLLVDVDGAANLHWEHVHFHYASWLGASAGAGYVDMQSAQLYPSDVGTTNLRLRAVRHGAF